MTKWMCALLMTVCFTGFAQKRISQYPNTGALAAGDMFVLEMGDGSTNKNIAYWQLKYLITNGLAGGVVLYSGLVQTNIAYTTNTVIDCQNAQNVYWMTNEMANHINVRLTNWQAPQLITLILKGASSATNWNVYVTPDLRAPMDWLTLTNGSPSTTITSNQTMQLDFMALTSSVATNVTAAWKETYK